MTGLVRFSAARVGLQSSGKMPMHSIPCIGLGAYVHQVIVAAGKLLMPIWQMPTKSEFQPDLLPFDNTVKGGRQSRIGHEVMIGFPKIHSHMSACAKILWTWPFCVLNGRKLY